METKQFICWIAVIGPGLFDPRFEGVILWLERKEALWDKFVIAAHVRRQSRNTAIANFDCGAEPGTGDQTQDDGQMA